MLIAIDSDQKRFTCVPTICYNILGKNLDCSVTLKGTESLLKGQKVLYGPTEGGPGKKLIKTIWFHFL